MPFLLYLSCGCGVGVDDDPPQRLIFVLLLGRKAAYTERYISTGLTHDDSRLLGSLLTGRLSGVWVTPIMCNEAWCTGLLSAEAREPRGGLL